MSQVSYRFGKEKTQISGNNMDLNAVAVRLYYILFPIQNSINKDVIAQRCVLYYALFFTAYNITGNQCTSQINFTFEF